MNRYPLWKYAIVALSLVFAVLYTLPNFFVEVPAVQVSSARLPVDRALAQRIDQILTAGQVQHAGTEIDPNGIKVRFPNADTQISAKDLLQRQLGNGYVVALNLLSSAPHWLSAIGALPMYLGLDLRGGVHFLLQVDMRTAVSKSTDRFVTEIRSALRDKRIPYSGISRRGNSIVVNFRDEASRSQGENVISQLSELALKEDNAASGFALIATLKPQAMTQIQDYALQQNLTTLRKRINELGVAEPIIQQQGRDRVVVQLPGVQDTAKAKDILGRTATLEIRLVDEENAAAAAAGQVPFGSELLRDRDGTPILVKKNVILTGESISDAAPGFDSQTSEPVVHVTLNGAGARVFKQVTRENVGRRMAILLIEKGQAEVVTAPVIREEIGGGRVQISGRMTSREASDVALLLRAGALAAPMDIIEERTVGPSLGAENISKGFHSTLVGFIAIAIFMVIYYRVFGLIASFALGVNLLLLVAILSLLQATLTLPGIAGIALTVGMAIDANVLIFERIREELRNGNSPQAAIHAGYDRAFDTILDSNITTLIAGVALFSLGSGPVRGFAVTLCIGILTSMFSAVMVSRAVVNLTYGRVKRLTKLAV